MPQPSIQLRPMRPTILCLMLCVLFVPSGKALSQHLRLGAEGGMSFIDKPDSYTQDVSAGGLGFNVEMHAGALGKFELESFPLTLTGRIQYTWMTGSGTVNSNQVSGATGNYSTFADILVVAAGTEWVTGPQALLPHISTEILVTEVGQVSFSNSQNGPSSPFLKNASTRIGFALGGGLEHSFSALVHADLHIRYNWNNLIVQSRHESSLNTLDVSLALYLVLY
jgi:opacity protein-like surface antigen